VEDLLAADLESAKSLLGGMADVAVVVDRDGRILYTNREAPGQAVTGTTVFEHDLGADAEARMRAALHQVFTASKPMSYEVEAPGDEPGKSAWYVSRWSPIEREGEVVAALIVSSDITRRITLERADWQQVILESAAEGILGLDSEGCVSFANSAAGELLGADQAELGGRSIHDLVHSDHADRPAHGVGECPVLLTMRDGIVQHMEDDVFWRHDGTSFPVRYTASPIVEDDQLMGAVLTFNDVTERKRFEAQLQYLADHDAVTGLYNRRRFEQELARHLSYDARYGTGGAVLALDLDNFKYVNDTLGHKAGDEVISRVARTVAERLRETDTLARLGGDEFVILLPEAGIEEAQSVARLILDAVRTHAVTAAGQQIRVTTSIGVTTFGNREIDGESLLVEADLAMYDAKSAGRDRFALYTPMAVREAQIESRLAWVGRVRDALDEDRFTLYSQPVISVATGEAVQHELLLRMVQDNEIVLPGSFIASAERFGLMPAVDRWVVRQAVRLLADSDPSLRVEVNVSGESMADDELGKALGAELAETGIEPDRLVIEVIEQTAVGNLDETRRFAQQVRHLGCRFAIDDFGAGFGSFYYLKYLPFDYLKIDGDFIHSLPANRTDQLVVQAVADIARGLGKSTIAEFVGDDDTVSVLRDCGVDLAQGYHLGRPGPASQLAGTT
jgi:diguanylate cyclase (GGDEF)-like protein/PAS domain S-box-containing protein